MIYKFKNGQTWSSKSGSVDAQAVGEELERIRLANAGRLDSKTVVNEAKSEKSPLHGAFTWDLEKAATRCWMMEAATLIRAVTVEIGGVERPAFVSVSVKTGTGEEREKENDRYYQSINVVALKPDEYESALAAARSRLFSAQASLDDLYEIAKEPQRSQVRKAQKHVQFAARELRIDDAAHATSGRGQPERVTA